MALTRADVLMWEEIAPLVSAAPRVLEIGQANWYGDVMPDERDADPDPFVVARNFYKRMMPGATFTAIDKHGRPGAIDLDLNEDISGHFEKRADVWQRLNVIINTGTAEHVFNQQRLFGMVNSFCSRGGLMIHAAPITGWWEHGFYLYNPTFFADLAAANGYEVVYLSQWNRNYGQVTRLANFGDARPQVGDSMLYVVYRKVKDAPFVVPMQGRYKGAEALPDAK